MKKIYKLIACVCAMAFINGVNVYAFEDTDVNKQETSVYPNPSSQFVNVVSQTLITRIEVRSLNGYVYFETNVDALSYKLDVTAWPRGKYVITIFHEKDFEFSKITLR